MQKERNKFHNGDITSESKPVEEQPKASRFLHAPASLNKKAKRMLEGYFVKSISKPCSYFHKTLTDDKGISFVLICNVDEFIKKANVNNSQDKPLLN